ncbi:MAG TPA: peptidylprolyl isomerase [Acidimicrobiales bacterium]|nr:peptidylprolyl isomerase [Acidimicrobiales bacterium]
MPSDKRQRQRENSLARQQAIAAAEQQAKRRRQIIGVVAGAIAIVGALYFFGPLGGSDDDDSSATSTTTTTRAKSSKVACPPKEGTAERTTTFAAAPKGCIDVDKSYSALIKTDAGDVTVELDPKIAPETVNSFVFLARNRFYEGLTFHRVLKNFMIQGGDPEGTGGGGPGYTIPDEFSPKHKFRVGDIAMAKTAAPDSGGSQFFVVIGPQGEALPPQYTFFGRVTSGLDVVKAIEADGAESDPNPPAVVHKIVSVTITEE